MCGKIFANEINYLFIHYLAVMWFLGYTQNASKYLIIKILQELKYFNSTNLLSRITKILIFSAIHDWTAAKRELDDIRTIYPNPKFSENFDRMAELLDDYSSAAVEYLNKSYTNYHENDYDNTSIVSFDESDSEIEPHEPVVNKAPLLIEFFLIKPNDILHIQRTIIYVQKLCVDLLFKSNIQDAFPITHAEYNKLKRRFSIFHVSYNVGALA